MRSNWDCLLTECSIMVIWQFMANMAGKTGIMLFPYRFWLLYILFVLTQIWPCPSFTSNFDIHAESLGSNWGWNQCAIWLVGWMVGIGTRVTPGGDALFFHYSGHGGRERDSNAASGYVETLCPEVREGQNDAKHPNGFHWTWTCWEIDISTVSQPWVAWWRERFRLGRTKIFWQMTVSM